MRLAELNDRQVAGAAALLSVAVALLFFVVAVLSGGSYAVDETRMFNTNDAPEVRYVMNYEVDPALYSFYESETKGSEALTAANP